MAESIHNNKNKIVLLIFQLLAIVIIIYGAHLRFATVAQTFVLNPVRADAADYFNYSENLVTKGVFSRSATGEPDALRAPGFPVFAAIFYEKGDIHNTIVAQTILQVLVFLILSFMVYSHLSRPAYLVFLWILWTFPHWISMNVYFLSESLFISLIGLLLCLSSKSNLKSADWILIGICISFMSLTKFTTEYFPIFLLVILIYCKKVTAKNAVAFFIAAMLPVIIWKIRNYLQIGSFTDPTLTINGLYHGSFVDFMYKGDPATQGIAYRFDPDAQKYYEGTGTTIKLIFEKMLSNPGEYLTWYLYGKQTFLWRWDILAGMGDIWVYPITYTAWYELVDMQMTHFVHKSIHNYWIIMGLVIAAVCLFKRNLNYLVIVCASLVVYCFLIHAITAPYPRYGIPFKLPLMILFVFGIDYCIRKTCTRFSQ